MKALFKSINLIGDALNIAPAWRAWIKQQTEPVEVWMWTLNDHVAPLYYGMVRDFLTDDYDEDKSRHLKTFCVVFDRPNMKFDFEHTFNVSDVVENGKIIAQGAFQLSDRKKQHVAQSYADLLNVKIGDTKADLKPTYIPFEEELPIVENVHLLEGAILISMFSASCTSRDPKLNGVPNKMLPFDKWVLLMDYLYKTFPNTPIRFLGAPTDHVPAFLATGDAAEMFGIPLNRLALIMKKAKLLITIDNGMAHLAATQETPTFEMYPLCLGTHYILPVGNPNLQFVHMDPRMVKPGYLLANLHYAVSKFERRKWCF